jgi:hypothetical protein
MDNAHAETLKAKFGGPITPKQLGFLRDIQGFIDFCVENDLSFPVVLTTLAQDVNGMLSHGDSAFFRPQVDGYAKSMKDLSEMANDPDLMREPAQKE